MNRARFARSTAGLGVATLLGVGLVGVAATPAYAYSATDTASLNAAIAANEAVIEIDADFTLEDDILPISHDVEIIGNGATIDADGWEAFRFYADANVRNLTVEDTSTAYYAEVGAGGTLTFTDVSATVVNYAIDVDSLLDGATVTITGGEFTEVSRTAIDLEDDFGSATVAISDVTIENADGGIIVNGFHGTSTLTITGVTITDTSYPINYYAYGDSTATVTGTHITAGPNRNSGGSGYGVYPNLADAATFVFDAGSIIGDPHGDRFSTGLETYQWDDSSVTVRNSTISGNETNVWVDAFDPGASFTMTGSVITDAEDYNVYICDLAGTGLIDQTTVADGGIDGPDPGIYAYVYDGGELTISRSTVSGHSGGGIELDLDDDGTSVTIVNSTISGNDGDDGEWAAIDVYGYDVDSSFSLLHSTVTANTDVDAGLAVDNVGTVTVSHSILSGNDVDAEELHLYENVEATIDYSLLGGSTIAGASTLTEGSGIVPTSDPGLAPLADNGGPTLTHALLETSPAHDGGDADITGAPETDQRGQARIQGAAIDLGALEMATPAPPTLPATGAETGAGIASAMILLLLGAGLITARRRSTA